MSEATESGKIDKLTVSALVIAVVALLLHAVTIDLMSTRAELADRLSKTDQKCTALRNDVESYRAENYAVIRLIQESTDLKDLKQKIGDSFPSSK